MEAVPFVTSLMEDIQKHVTSEETSDGLETDIVMLIKLFLLPMGP